MASKSTIAKAPASAGEQPPGSTAAPAESGVAGSSAVAKTETPETAPENAGDPPPSDPPPSDPPPPSNPEEDLAKADRAAARDEIQASVRRREIPAREVLLRAGASPEEADRAIDRGAKLLALEWGGGMVRDPGGEWRAPTEDEMEFHFADIAARTPGSDVRVGQVGEATELVAQTWHPLRQLVELIKRNNRELLRLTGHLVTAELMEVEAALDVLAAEDERWQDEG